MKVFNKLLIICVISLFLINAFSIVFAEEEMDLEIDYPQIHADINAPETSRTFLPKYIQYVYSLSVLMSGLIAFLALIYGGFRYLTSVGNPSAMQDARDQIFSGILGMVVIFGSYVILKELNPALTSFSLPEMRSAHQGIILYSDNNCGEGLGNGEPWKANFSKSETDYISLGNTRSNFIDNSGAARMKTIGSLWSFHDNNELFVSFYRDEKCSPESLIKGVDNLHSDDCIRVDIDEARCVKLSFRDPGVWIFSGQNGDPIVPASDMIYYNFKSSQDSLPSDITDRVGSVALFTNQETGTKYGAIIHNMANGKIGWSIVLLPDDSKDITRYNLEGQKTKVSAITVFKIPVEGGSPGDIFTLYRQSGKVMMSLNTGPDGELEEVEPQVKIGWENATKADHKLEDIAQQICSSGIAYNFSDLAHSGSSGNAKCEGLKNIVGGIKIANEGNLWKDWKSGGSKDIEILGGAEIKSTFNRTRDEGVSGFYMPSTGNQYIAILYDSRASDPASAAKESCCTSRSAALTVTGSYSNLGTAGQTWDKKLSTLVVIKIDP